MSARPDSPWHYARAFYALVKAESKLHRLIRFVGRTEFHLQSKFDDEMILDSLNEIEHHLNYARQIASDKSMDLTQKIEAELALKDCNAGQLKDTTGATYAEIFAVLKRLVDEGKASHYFDSNSTLTYQPVKQPFWKIR
ncbi:hypothetical protein VF14_32645 [Nostoc linckia z18]|uniref:Uncharacterized protein n=2 Tax=Nostoc linckia TaxID=92942 RepID=A0A9Q5Z7K5_NOSLI|nr:hypothetical protein [Nostoc linckia]PHK33595.1 hypothetical protein VF12_25070 [Nostoc linckia z15]PHK44577.1 hypothetical protein VF13_21480 [Nostoc linckia z16]PHJ59621.1 hypothetical protein VF02_24755 [Nostoc linckia z1]PHJ59913.1 hypothetical protein VF03_33985 [Nostoc linckia z2]PHJ65101.1 hypothetical protein VF05_21395 [Nostoc linckia z3]